MRKGDFVKMGIKNLWRRKLRTTLTIIGVMIGAFSIIVMVSLGIAMSKNYEEQIMELGSLTTIEVSKYYYGENNNNMDSYQAPKKKELDDSLVAQLKKIPHVQAVTPVKRISAKLKSGKYESWIDIQGIDPATIPYFEFPEVTEGRMLTAEDTTELLVGKDACYFYNPNSSYHRYDSNAESPVDLINDKLEITFDTNYDEDRMPTYQKIKVAGIMEETGNEKDWTIYANIEQVLKWKKELKRAGIKTYDDEEGYNQILVSVDNIKYVDQVQSTIKAMEYGTSSLSDVLKPMQETANTLQLILGGIGAISLLVSAIGIANTMIMSIYERTKEIGVMKVLGCLISDIRKLFLFEAAMIGFFGGICGIGMSYLASYLLNKYGGQIGNALGGFGGGGGKISVIPLWLVLASLAFSVLVGIISGYYPARRATKIKALEAMRE